MDAPGIQKATGHCYESAGGVVCLASGVYPGATIAPTNHVTLRLEAGATLLGSPKSEGYPPWTEWRVDPGSRGNDKHLSYAREAENVTVSNYELESTQPDFRPELIREDVRDLDVSGLRAEASHWQCG